MDAIDQALSRLMTCAPAQCPRETDCFKIAKWALEQRRLALAAEAAPPSPAMDEISNYAPNWEAPRRALPDWDAA